MENIQNLISYKKGYIDFCRQTSSSPQKRLSPWKQYFLVFSENTAVFEKKKKKNC